MRSSEKELYRLVAVDYQEKKTMTSKIITPSVNAGGVQFRPDLQQGLPIPF
jgi:hypothetical protein